MGSQVHQTGSVPSDSSYYNFTRSQYGQPNTFGGLETNHVPYQVNSGIVDTKPLISVDSMLSHTKFSSDNDLMGSQYNPLHQPADYVSQARGLHVQSDHYPTQSLSNQSTSYIPANHQLVTDHGLNNTHYNQSIYKDGMFGISGTHAMTMTEDMNRPGNIPEHYDGRAYNGIDGIEVMNGMRGFGDTNSTSKPSDVNSYSDGIHNVRDTTNMDLIYQGHYLDSTNQDQDPQRISPSISQSDKQTQTLTDSESVLPQEKRKAKRETSVTAKRSNFEEKEPNNLHSLEQRNAEVDNSLTRNDTESVQQPKREQQNDRVAKPNYPDRNKGPGETKANVPVHVNKVTPSRRPVPTPRDRSSQGTSPKSGQGDIDDDEMRKERKLPQPAPRTREVRKENNI